MRTKTILLTAALVAAGAVTASAQVYSVNAVGYVQETLMPGFNLVANPLDASNNGGNVVSNLFTSVPDGTTVYTYDPSTSAYSISTYSSGGPFGAGWSTPDMTVAPGGGAFVYVPGTDNVTVTFVGEVEQGQLSNPLPQGFAIASSMVPQAGAVSTDLGYPAADGDTIYTFDASTQGYSVYTYSSGGPFGAGWSPSEPQMTVGQAFWSLKAAAADWTRNFTVNQ
jgi:hypothetical protein